MDSVFRCGRRGSGEKHLLIDAVEERGPHGYKGIERGLALGFSGPFLFSLLPPAWPAFFLTFPGDGAAGPADKGAVFPAAQACLQAHTSWASFCFSDLRFC